MSMSVPYRQFALPGAVATSLAAPLAQAQTADEAAYDLETLVITASGFEQRIADAPASITVIGSEEFEGRANETVVDIVKDVAGVTIEQGGKLSGATVSIRGLPEDYVLFLVDGKPVGSTEEAFYNGWGSGQKTGYLPPASAIDRVEVIRGPMSSLYGTDAAGGVINIITKPVPSTWEGSLTLGTTVPQDEDTGHSREGRFYLSGPIVEDKLGLTLYGQAHDREADSFVPGMPEGQRRTLGGKLSWSLNENNDLDFEVRRTRQDFEATEDNATRTGDVQNEFLSYGLTHTLRWGAGFETTTFLIDENVDISNGDLESSYGKTEFNTKTNVTLGRHTLTFGADYTEETTEHDEARFSPSVATGLERWHYALFAEDEFQMTDDFALTLGLRYDENENYGSQITPRVYGVYKATPNLTIKGGISGGYKVPELKQADDLIAEPSGGPRNNALDIGNTDLEPEESTNYEIGAVWDAPSGLQLGGTIYHTTFRNKIDRESLCDTPEEDRFQLGGQTSGTCSYGGVDNYVFTSEYVNRENARLSGVELTFDMPFGDFDLSGNYTYADSEITSGDAEGDPFTNTPMHKVNLGLDWNPASSALGAWTDVNYRSETNVVAEDDPVPGYTLVDSGMTYDFNDSFTGAFAVYNVFDKQMDSETYGQILDGRRFYVGLTSRF
ncbi:TonB-dependent receptor domain-containing protein [Roseivivax sediminis]|uniref:Outer membrane receptor for ferrienterochelin and colicins n=1 Tax=Roseivivax sediminis TaxID=936889 RepID=A0A1I1V7H3_9RHOB|nr:TonB-dependent receptor [Roseivivax sediminis]SFD78967.1 outer membrane receptor for ferrienterochelin and colicins [Roseivivax sediminis]